VFLPGGSGTTTKHKCTSNTYISNKIKPLKKNKSPQKATQTMKDILQAMNTLKTSSVALVRK
jgi:hypothetical protein